MQLKLLIRSKAWRNKTGRARITRFPSFKTLSDTWRNLSSKRMNLPDELMMPESEQTLDKSSDHEKELLFAIEMDVQSATIVENLDISPEIAFIDRKEETSLFQVL